MWTGALTVRSELHLAELAWIAGPVPILFSNIVWTAQQKEIRHEKDHDNELARDGRRPFGNEHRKRRICPTQ